MMLGEIAEIRSGSLLDRSGADAYYVLVSDVTPRGLRTSHFSDGTLPQKSSVVAALTVGHVVVALRGTSNPAAAVPSLELADRPVFATLDVAVLRLGKHILPAYLAWFLNLPRTQETLAADRSGSAAPRLPLSALKDLHVPVPTHERQAMIAAVANEAQRERDLIGNIQQSRQRLLEELLCQAADEGPVPGGNPARTDHRLISRDATMRALSNPNDWKR